MRGLKSLTLFAITILSLPVLAATADGTDPVKYNLRIDKQSLSTALQEFATQSGVQIIFFAKVTDGIEAPSLKGKFTAADAVARLLDHSDLTFQQLNPKTIQVEPKAAVNDLKKTVGSSFVGPSSPLHLAQSDSPAPQDSGQSSQGSSENSQNSQNQSTASLPSSEGKENGSKLEEVVVTGTHISGTPPVFTTITIDQQEIERSGYQTSGELIRSLPQSFGGGLNATTVGAGGSQNTPSPTGASTANLRGLGSESTLMLVDGQRLAATESGTATDLSLIPISAIQRVEIVTDGASAIYGSDAVAGVVNFIMRTDFRGVEATGTWGRATGGGGFQQKYDLLAGNKWNTGHALVSYEYADQNAIDSSQRSYISPSLVGTTLLPETKRHSIFLNAGQTITDYVGVFAEGLYTKRFSVSGYNDFAFAPGEIDTTSARVEQYGIAFGITSQLGNSWHASLSTNLAGNTSAAPVAEIVNGALSGQIGTLWQNRLRAIEADANGDLIALPTGYSRGAIGIGYRSESASAIDLFNAVAPVSGGRKVSYAFTELFVPLVAESKDRLGLQRLSSSIAVRYERYSDFGGTTNPKLGVLYVPFDSLRLNASWGTSFRAPSLQTIDSSPYALLEPLPDPLSATGTSNVLLRFGANRQILPEKSSDATIGLTLTPTGIPGLTLQLEGYRIEYKDRIAAPTSDTSSPLTDPFVQPFVQRNPTVETLGGVISQSQFYNFTGAPYDPTAIAAIVDDRNQNLTREVADGIDGSVAFRRTSSWGTLDWSANVAYLNSRQRNTPLTAIEQLSGTVFNPPRLRGRFGIAWERSAWSAAAFLNYTGSSRDPEATTTSEISSWTTADLHLERSFDIATDHGLHVSASVQNLFNRRPPFVEAVLSGAPGLHYDSTNASAIGRFVTFQVSQRW